MRSAPGCLAADCWNDDQTEAIVTTGLWVDARARQDTFQVVAAADIDFDYDEREERPCNVYSFTSL